MNLKNIGGSDGYVVSHVVSDSEIVRDVVDQKVMRELSKRCG
jgi:hypothetical protein